MLDADVGGGEAELPAHLLAMHHAAVDRVRSSKQSCRMFHASAGQCVAHCGARCALASLRDAAHRIDLKAMVGAALAKHVKVAATIGTKSEIVANDQVLDAQAAHQNAFDEFFRR